MRPAACMSLSFPILRPSDGPRGRFSGGGGILPPPSPKRDPGNGVPKKQNQGRKTRYSFFLEFEKEHCPASYGNQHAHQVESIPSPKHFEGGRPPGQGGPGVRPELHIRPAAAAFIEVHERVPLVDWGWCLLILIQKDIYANRYYVVYTLRYYRTDTLR